MAIFIEIFTSFVSVRAFSRVKVGFLSCKVFIPPSPVSFRIKCSFLCRLFFSSSKILLISSFISFHVKYSFSPFSRFFTREGLVHG